MKYLLLIMLLSCTGLYAEDGIYTDDELYNLKKSTEVFYFMGDLDISFYEIPVNTCAVCESTYTWRGFTFILNANITNEKDKITIGWDCLKKIVMYFKNIFELEKGLSIMDTTNIRQKEINRYIIPEGLRENGGEWRNR